MTFWLREIVGWLLVGAGLFIFYICLGMLVSDRPRLLHSGPLTFIGFFVFRGGIHLLKVSAAARICLHAHKEVLRREGESGRGK